MKYFKSLNGKEWYKVPDEKAIEFKKPQFIEVTKSEFLAINPEPTKDELEQREHESSVRKQIASAKHYLSSTDWIITKIAEETDPDEIASLRSKYASVITERKAARARINELEAELK